MMLKVGSITSAVSISRSMDLETSTIGIAPSSGAHLSRASVASREVRTTNGEVYSKRRVSSKEDLTIAGDAPVQDFGANSSVILTNTDFISFPIFILGVDSISAFRALGFYPYIRTSFIDQVAK